MMPLKNKEQGLNRKVQYSWEAECEAGKHKVNQGFWEAAPCHIKETRWIRCFFLVGILCSPEPFKCSDSFLMEKNLWSLLLDNALWVQSLGQEDTPEYEMASHSPVFLLGKFHGQRSLEGYSPWCRRELDTTEQRNLAHKSIYFCFKNWALEQSET